MLRASGNHNRLAEQKPPKEDPRPEGLTHLGNYKKNYYAVMEYEWDEAKAQSNLTKHGLHFADAEHVFCRAMRHVCG